MLQVLTIGLSAFLIFNLQPMISKIILPLFGGSSYIWITCLIFFQSLLLAGYATSHFIAKNTNLAKQVVFYALLIILSLLLIPIQIRFIHTDSSPVAAILVLLFVSAGLPYFLLSTTSPTVQHWIVAEKKDRARNPYVQYAVSNAGSLAGLLSYPFVIEPLLSNSRQTKLWSWGYILYTVLLSLCLIKYVVAVRSCKNSIAWSNPGPSDDRFIEKIATQTKIKWLYQAMIPCASLVVFTNYMTVDIANFPLLWVLPLCVYLVSFIICFLWPAVSRPGPIRTVSVLVPVVVMSFILFGNLNAGLLWKTLVSLVSLFAICMFFHGNLERNKPEPKNLTSFYLYISMGGCLGGILAGIAAPMMFSSIVEFHMVIIASFFFTLWPYVAKTRKKIRIVFQTALWLLVAATYLSQEVFLPPSLVLQDRSFYGTYRVVDYQAISYKHLAHRILYMGTTNHGGQARDSENKLYPIAYYHEHTGVGKSLLKTPNLKNIGMVGLGTGVLALYGKKGQHFDFFEIDPVVVDIAKQHFDNLKASAADIRYFVGDARITIREMPKNHYDMLVMDAFSSGAIPTHLLTWEAMKELLETLKVDGVILYHISSRYLNLLPVLECNARKLGLFIKINENPPIKSSLKLSAKWVVLTRSKRTLNMLAQDDPTWKTPPDDEICWTDESSNIWSIINRF
ncbi:MAG: fused MFS/spermidine synthase [Desulfobacteraceae bacterium]|nr:fused MFS/spermidine synthase [Desulfobacteraceae bacterium]MDH3722664.1 fused MFS/spermidine synthase [Desulfobacteraceae bacterium]